ncbi:MAG TPA: winged helix-turn-helix domain-containing protein [Ktedonobacterales bacterium]|jgi:DNA-binding response OmpR family regulator
MDRQHNRATTPDSRQTLLGQEPLPVPFGPNLWFDAATCSILHKNKRLPLTKREHALLTLLMKAPNRIHHTSDLADQLTNLGVAFPVDEHSVEQTIYLLRRKLGESGKRPRILLTHHGIGYGLFPQNAADAEPPPTPQLRQSKARAFPQNVKKT